MKDKVTVKLVHERDTKRKRRFQEEGDEDVIGTLYVDKETSKELGDPDKLKVTIEVG